MNDIQLGARIQAYRTQAGLSVRKLSALAGITPSMLSQIENEQVNPSINTLRAVATALDVPLYVLFRSAPTADPVVRPEQRRIIGSRSEPDVRYELLTPDGSGQIEFCLMVIPPRRSSYRDAASHAGEEVAYCLSGSAEIELDGLNYSLRMGDSLRIPPDTPHVWRNPGSSEAQIIFAITPPTF